MIGWLVELSSVIALRPYMDQLIVGRPNLQKVPETLLLRARLRAFSKLFLDLASFS